MIECDTDIHGLLHWELREDGNGCLLTFTSTLDAPEDVLPKVLAGWHSHLDFLAEALDGHPIDWPNWPMDHWTKQYERYAARFS